MDALAERRRFELEEAAPKKKRNVEPFVKVPLWWIQQAATTTKSPTTLVCIELLHRSWKAKGPTFLLPNGNLRKLGVSREIKRRVLRDLEKAGLITVKRPIRKAPIVTLVGL